MSAAVLHLVLRWRVKHQLPHLSEEEHGVLGIMQLVRGEAHAVAALLLAARGSGLDIMMARTWLLQARVRYQGRCMTRLHIAMLEARTERDHALNDLEEERALIALLLNELAERDRARNSHPWTILNFNSRGPAQ